MRLPPLKQQWGYTSINLKIPELDWAVILNPILTLKKLCSLDCAMLSTTCGALSSSQMGVHMTALWVEWLICVNQEAPSTDQTLLLLLLLKSENRLWQHDSTYFLIIQKEHSEAKECLGDPAQPDCTLCGSFRKGWFGGTPTPHQVCFPSNWVISTYVQCRRITSASRIVPHFLT